jgi:hypothetical protein
MTAGKVAARPTVPLPVIVPPVRPLPAAEVRFHP